MPTSDGITAAAESDGISSCLTGRPLLPRLDCCRPCTLAEVGVKPPHYQQHSLNYFDPYLESLSFKPTCSAMLGYPEYDKSSI